MLYTEVLELLESDEHLEHFGIKGMHWGSRKSQTSDPNSGGKMHKPMSTQTKKKIATGVGAALLGGLAVGLAGKHLKQIKQDKALLDKSRKLTDDIFSKYGAMSFSDIDQSRKDFGLAPIFR